MSEQRTSKERIERAAEFSRRLKASGLTISEFQHRSGLSRNVVYNLSIGQRPKPEQAKALEEAFNGALGDEAPRG
jgi:uncharacterized protein YnzC (UPF0291/DUF896 family)